MKLRTPFFRLLQGYGSPVKVAFAARTKVNYYRKLCRFTVTQKGRIFEIIKLDEKIGARG
jgi:hypothetical protein